jgi:hypothetical protein
MGNPVNFTDPSGYLFSGWGHFWHKVKHESARIYHDSREVVAIAASVAVIAMTAGTATPAVASAWSGFFGSYAIIASGAAAGAVSSGIMTGTVEGAAKGALWGGISAGVANGVADGVSALTGVDAHNASFLSSGFTEASVTKAIAHGLSRVAISELRYGTTKGAFLSGFVSSGFSVGKGASPEARTLVMAIVGGTASELGGGKFANGALGSVFQYMFNDMASFKKSMSQLGTKLTDGTITGDIGQGFEGGLEGYREVRDSAPIGIRLWLKGLSTATEMGATAGLSSAYAVGYDMISGAYFDSYQTTKASLGGFYLKMYIDKSLGTDPVTLQDFNPYK